MAATVDPEKSLDLAHLSREMAKALPAYARPLFIRLVDVMDMTGTYKLRKVDYQKEAYDISRVKDPIYFLESASQSYVPLTTSLYQQLFSGQLRI